MTKKSIVKHWIMQIRISIGTKGTKFQLKLTILIFSTKFAQKGYMRPKTNKVNATIKFFIFE